MTHVGYVAAGWSLALLTLGGYALRLLHRERRLTKQVEPDERRWTSAARG